MFLISTTSQKLVLAPGATIRDKRRMSVHLGLEPVKNFLSWLKLLPYKVNYKHNIKSYL